MLVVMMTKLHGGRSPVVNYSWRRSNRCWGMSTANFTYLVLFPFKNMDVKQIFLEYDFISFLYGIREALNAYHGVNGQCKQVSWR